MANHSRKLRALRLAVIGTVLMLSVSLATAAIVMWIPESPVEVDQGEHVALNVSPYLLLHQARNSSVPPYVRVGLADPGR